MYKMIPLVTRQDHGEECAVLSILQVPKDMEGREGILGYMYWLVLGSPSSENNIVYSIGAEFIGLSDGWLTTHVDVQNALSRTVRIYKVYNEEILEQICAQEPFIGIDYVDPLIEKGDQPTTLYFDTNVTPDFDKLDWSQAQRLGNYSQDGMRLTYDGLSLIQGDGFHIYVLKSTISGSTDENVPDGTHYDIVISQEEMVLDGPTAGYLKAIYSDTLGWRNASVDLVEFNPEYSRTIIKLLNVSFWGRFIDDEPFEGVDYNA